MTVTEKIFAMHAIDSKGYVRTGDTIRVSLDWIMASEASWAVSNSNFPIINTKPRINLC